MKKLVTSLAMVMSVAVMSDKGWGQITSAQTGDWSSTSTWTGNSVPGASDGVVIADGHTVTIDQDVSVASISVGQGTSGTLTFDGVAARAVTISGDLTVSAAATFITQSSGSFTNTMTIGGNLANNGTFDMSQGGTTLLCNVTFNKSGSQTVSGSGETTRFFLIVVDEGTSNSNVLEISSSNFAASDTLLGRINGVAGLKNGTFKMSASYTFSAKFFGVAGYTIPATAGIWLNNSNVTVTGQNGSPQNNGLLRITAGTYNVGTQSGNSMTYIGGSQFTIEGGSLNVAGRLSRSSSGSTTTYSQSGGTVTVVTSASISTSFAGFDIGASGSSFTTSGGTMIIRNATSNASDFLNVAATSSVTGGTLQIGDASSGNAQTMKIQSTVALQNLTVSGATSQATKPTAKLVTSDLTLKGSLTIQSGTTFDANSLNLSIAGNWSNSGTFTSGTQTVTLNGTSAQSYTQSGTGTFSGFTLNNSNGLTMNNDLTVNGTLTLTSGNLTTGSNTLTLGSNASISGEAAGRYVVGNLSVTKTVGTAESTLGGIGVALDAGADVGDVTVTRVSGSSGAVTIAGKSGINRKWTITTTTAPASAKTLTLSWISDDDNSKTLTAMRVWKSTDGGSTFSDISGSDQNASSRSIDVSVSSFSIFTVSDNSNPLPVQLTSFTATAKRLDAELRWTTATEVRNYGFEIERRLVRELLVVSGNRANQLTNSQSPINQSPLTNWSKIAFLPGAGTSNAPHEYSYTDRGLAPARYAYRIKQIDNDGTFEYHHAAEVEIGLAPKALKLEPNYPNPFNPSTNIEFTLPEDGRAVLKVFDLLGREVAHLFEGEAEAGRIHLLRFDASRLSAGVYYTRLECRDQQLVRKLLLVK